MKKFLVDLLTEDDGQTFCIGRFSALMCVGAFITATIIHVLFNHASVGFLDLGAGFGALLTGAGAFIGVKAATQKES